MLPIVTNGRDPQRTASGEGPIAPSDEQGRQSMWLRHWGISHDPFAEDDPLFVALPGHAEARARLVHVVETGHRLAVFQAAAGLGKTRVLNQALADCRGSSRRIVLLNAIADHDGLFAKLAHALGRPAPGDAPPGVVWKHLTDAMRMCHWQGLGVVLAIDDCQELSDRVSQIDLERLSHLAPSAEMKLTILQVGQPAPAQEGAQSGWDLRIWLAPMTRSEAVRYVQAKLISAGRTTPLFSPGAIARLHALAEGTPRGLNRLATLSLMAGALEGRALIDATHVEGAWQECAGGAIACSWNAPDAGGGRSRLSG